MMCENLMKEMLWSKPPETIEFFTIKKHLNEKPPFHIRQGLSLLLGAPLSGEFVPQNIMAAQATFASNQPQQSSQQAPTKNKKGSSSLTKSDKAYLTSSQARENRQQRSN